jgi:DNA-binding response OmpR family regulator
MQTVLVVDDEPKIAQLARDYLEHAGFAVLTAGDGASALHAARVRRPDLVVLDLGLPGLDGLDVLRQVRAAGPTPVVIVTARDTELDKLLGLELGAVLRRSQRAAEPRDRIEVGDLALDLPRLRATVGGRTVELTPTEFSILATMAREPGRVFTRSQLLDAVHGVAFDAYERAIDAHVKNLRHKIEPEPSRPRYLLTVYGVGYRIAEPD